LVLQILAFNCWIPFAFYFRFHSLLFVNNSFSSFFNYIYVYVDLIVVVDFDLMV
jgi:hypothetical protein